MRVTRREVLSLAAVATASPAGLRLARSQATVSTAFKEAQTIFPGSQWETARPEELGWSIQGLAEVYRFFASLPPSSG